MAYRPTTPFEAQEIAQHAVHYMLQIQQCRSLRDLTAAWAGWKLYADKAGVCRQIREHLSGEYAKVAQSIKESSVVRDPTGEQTNA